MSEVHVIGQIIGAKAFPDHRIFCKWSVHAGDQWRLLQGTIKGVTMLDVPVDNSKAVWMHPIDIHFATSSLKVRGTNLFAMVERQQFSND
ncbi:hypothetical protein GJ496_003782, partial [Pomphorhynchus laevis]